MRPEITTILLAAGQSRRMGARNKLLLQIHGVPMIRHMVLRYAAATGGAVLVVTGHAAVDVEDAIAGTGAKVVFNARHAKGQQTSVACGLRRAEDADAVLIGLGDQPLLTIGDLRTLVAAHRAADTNRISIPVDGDRRGNPILVPAAMRARLMADPKGPSCRRATRTQCEDVQTLPLSAPGFYFDVDTPEAYADVLRRVPDMQP